DGIRDFHVTGVQTCALPISPLRSFGPPRRPSPRKSPAAPPSFLVFNPDVWPTLGDKSRLPYTSPLQIHTFTPILPYVVNASTNRSEERRVGKECRYTCGTC